MCGLRDRTAHFRSSFSALGGGKTRKPSAMFEIHGDVEMRFVKMTVCVSRLSFKL